MTRPTREQDTAFARERAKRTLPLIGFVLLGLIAIRCRCRSASSQPCHWSSPPTSV